MKPLHFDHPKPMLSRAIQIGALVLALIMALTVPLQIMLTVLGAPGGLFVLSAFFTLLLAAPVLMLTAVAPAVSIDADGITLHPAVWRDHHIPWGQVRAVKVYPLLPTEDSEVTRRAAVGKRNYTPAAGIMLIVPDLPPVYRIAGFFAGERTMPIVALTNRAHANYGQLLRLVLEYTDSSIQDPVLHTSTRKRGEQ